MEFCVTLRMAERPDGRPTLATQATFCYAIPMGDAAGNDSSRDASSSVDLSQLQGLNFGPDWSDRSDSSIITVPGGGDRRDKRRAPGGKDRGPANRDRAPGGDRRSGGGSDRRSSGGDRRGAPHPEGRGPRPGEGDRPNRPRRSDGPTGGDSGGGRSPGRQGGQRGRRPEAPRPEPFEPCVEAVFYPEDTPFKALCHAMRTNCRTYELFEIARLILEKPERFVVVVQPKKGARDAGETLFQSVPDGLPFETEKDALNHVLASHFERFFDIEEAEVEPPKGNFPVITKCGITGELIGPPNYHRYQALLQAHHAAHLSRMPFERFTSRLESVKGEEAVQQWAEKMSKVKRYRPKEREDDTPEYFEDLESARYHLATRKRDRVLRAVDQVRIAGNRIENLPEGNRIRRSLEAILEHQRTFPLDTANNLRGRLRRLKFTIYKRGSKGVSYVCAVRRRFRDPAKQFAESLQELLDFIEAHPMVKVTELPTEFLGLDPEPEPLATPPTESAPAIEGVSKEEAAKIVEKHEIERQARIAAAKAAAAE